MSVCSGVGKIVRRKGLLLAPLAVLALAAPAAAQAENSTVYIGSPGNDVFNEHGQPGNFRLWGLGGFNGLAGGQGDNYLVGNGSCPASKYNTMGYDNATEQWDAYCSAGQISGAPGAVLVGGGGVNTIIGSGGPNVIASGPDNPSSGTGNYIYGGPVGDAIAAIQGSSTIYPGAGTNVIDARGPDVDYIYCVKGDKHTVVYAERYDVIVNCARVVYGNPPQALSTSPSLAPSTLAHADSVIEATMDRITTRASSKHATTKKHSSTKRSRTHHRKTLGSK
jgi:hypothetical protein